jgi:chitodextrinase
MDNLNIRWFNKAMKHPQTVRSQFSRFSVLLIIGALVATGLFISGSARAAGLAFVQVVAAQPQTKQTTVTVTYTKAQAAGDTNVLAIGWGDVTSNIAKVSDSSGNTYAVAAPTVHGSAQSQAIYYASNIKAAAAGANTVTVTFNAAAAYVDLRASEYSGLATAPFDVAASATGSASTAASPSVTTSYSSELIFGAGDTSGVFSAAGTGFTKRIITNPDSDITEDKTVSAIGSYNATGKQSGAWVMQVAAFKAVGGAPDTTPPSVPTGLSATAVSQSQVNLSWTASTDNVGVTGYKVYRNGTQVGTTTTTSYQDTGLTAGTTYNYTVAAYDAAGNVSAQSTAAAATTQAPDTTPPSVPAGLSATAVSSTQINLSWTASTDNVGVTGYDVYRNGTQVGTTTTTTYQDTGLTAGTTYNYTVAAYDAAGNVSAQSTAAAATTTTTVAFVQADDTGTINGNTTSISSGQSHQVLAHNTGVGHSVVLMIQTLTNPGTETDTVTSVSSGMGTFQFVNSYNDGADYEIWVCTDTTGAADTVTVTTPTNAWDAFAVEFNAPATGYVNAGGQVFDPPYLSDQSWTVSPGAAGNVAVIGVDTLDAYNTGPAAPWTYYNSGYWSFFNGTSAAWQVAPSSAPLTATWQTDGGESNSQGVVLEY